MMNMRKHKNISMSMGILAAVTVGMLAVSVEAQDLHFDTEAVMVPSLSAVCDLYGTYAGAKVIDAMNCEIAVEITLNEDGTYSYYRAPMVVQMEGGGAATEMALEKQESEEELQEMETFSETEIEDEA